MRVTMAGVREVLQAVAEGRLRFVKSTRIHFGRPYPSYKTSSIDWSVRVKAPRQKTSKELDASLDAHIKRWATHPSYAGPEWDEPMHRCCQ